MIKKIMASILAVAMVAAMSTSAFAEEAPVDTASQEAKPMPLADLEVFIRDLDPAIYGGIYYDENHNLCINATDEVALSRSITKSRSSIGDITVKTAVYSMEELQTALDVLKEQSEVLGVKMVGFDEQKNSVVAYLIDDSEESKSLAKKACPIDNLILKKYEGSIREPDAAALTEENHLDAATASPKATTVYAGKKLSTYIGNPYSGTLTTSAVYPYSAGPSGWKVGMTSVAHAFSYGSNCYYQDSFFTGTTTYSSNSQYLDVAFIPSSYNSHGWINDNSGNLIQATSRRAPIAGDYAYMYGWKSGSRKSGTITETNMYENVGNVWHNGIFKYNMSPLMGDSGAPIVVRDSDGTWMIVGYNVAQYRDEHSGYGLGLDITALERYADIVPCT